MKKILDSAKIAREQLAETQQDLLDKVTGGRVRVPRRGSVGNKIGWLIFWLLLLGYLGYCLIK